MIQLKRFAGLGTGWKRMNDYQKARLKLNGIYVAVFFVFLNLFTISIFVILQKVEKDYVSKATIIYEKQIIFSKQNVTILEWNNGNKIDKEEIIKLHREFLSSIRHWIIIIEIVLLVLASIISYWLSGKTLQPIQKKNEKQKQFLADVSHELRNPLSAIQTSLEVAKKQTKWTESEIQETFNDLAEEIMRLTKITQDLITLEKSAQIKQICELAQICETQISRLKNYARQRNIIIDQKIEKYRYNCAKEEVEIVVYNLLQNAIKFSNPNSKVYIKLSSKGILTIRDNGVGIAEKDKAHIFDRFYKGDASRTFNDNTGSGLGLSIVKKIVERNSWKINMVSEQDKGTIFRVIF